jgi:hypothetical protein
MAGEHYDDYLWDGSTDDKKPEVRPRCMGCLRFPDELDCYTGVLEDGESADDYVRSEEGTFNAENGHFLCDACYINAGMPVGENGRRWVCP